MTVIEQIHAREVFDSRGRPTVEVEVRCRGARPGRAIVPSGASTGRFEAVELRDSNERRLGGSGVMQAVGNVRGEIAAALSGLDATDQRAIDQRLIELDRTSNKSRLGANALLGVSLATAYAAAEALGVSPVEHFRTIWEAVRISHPDDSAEMPAPEAAAAGATMLARREMRLPLPMVNMISGGLHAGGHLDFQDFLAIPVGAGSYREALDWIVAIYRALGSLLRESGYEGDLVGDEGGYGPRLESNSQAVECVLAAITRAGLEPGRDVCLGLDVASSHFYSEGAYHLKAGGQTRLTASEFIDLLESWVDSYPIISIEDGLAEDDWDGWREMTQRLGDRVQLIGDDLFVTNPQRLRQGITSGAANSVLIKLNQIGTLTETLQTLQMALAAGYWPVVSARSGETEDATIADLVVATGAGQIKVGSVARSERLAKYNQLLRLEEQLQGRAGYLGGAIFEKLAR